MMTQMHVGSCSKKKTKKKPTQLNKEKNLYDFEKLYSFLTFADWEKSKDLIMKSHSRNGMRFKMYVRL